jgi:hypothetical protein
MSRITLESILVLSFKPVWPRVEEDWNEFFVCVYDDFDSPQHVVTSCLATRAGCQAVGKQKKIGK